MISLAGQIWRRDFARTSLENSLSYAPAPSAAVLSDIARDQKDPGAGSLDQTRSRGKPFSDGHQAVFLPFHPLPRRRGERSIDVSNHCPRKMGFGLLSQ